MSTKTRQEREAAIAANALSPVRTLRALELMSERELANLETHLANLEAADPYADANKVVPRKAQATDDPDYQPHGAAPDGYAIALANRAETDPPQRADRWPRKPAVTR